LTARAPVPIMAALDRTGILETEVSDVLDDAAAVE
jgi:hypothetical protein